MLTVVTSAKAGLSSPFAKSDGVLVVRASSVLCSLDVGDNGASDEPLIVEASFGQSCGSLHSSVVCAKSGACECVASLRDWSNRGDGFRNVISISVPNHVVEVCEKCYRLRSVRFGASSTLERCCPQVFDCTDLESLVLPDNVVILS